MNAPSAQRKALMLSVLVHLLLFMALVLSFHWRVEIPEVSEVQLWDSLPTPPAPPIHLNTKAESATLAPPPVPTDTTKTVAPAPPEPKVAQVAPSPAPDIKLPTPKTTPPPKAVEALKAVETPKAVEAPKPLPKPTKPIEPPKPEPPKPEPPKPEPPKPVTLADLQNDLAQETPHIKTSPTSAVNNTLLSLQEELSKELPKTSAPTVPIATAPTPAPRVNIAPTASPSSTTSAEDTTQLNKYVSYIRARIRSFVNPVLCEGNPELLVKINLQPSGYLNGNPVLTKKSSSAVCDRAIESAILQAQPLPLPADPRLRALFTKEDLRLTFRPKT